MKTIIYILIFLTLLFLQTSLAQNLAIFGVVPGFVLVFLVLWSLENEKQAFALALILGLAFDMVFSSVFGAYTLALLGALALVRYLHKTTFKQIDLSSVFVQSLVASTLWAIIYLTVFFLFGESQDRLGLAKIGGLSIVLNTILALVLYVPVHALSEWLRQYDSYRKSVIR